MYEADIFYADDDIRYIELGCYNCPHKLYPTLKEWNKFKRALEKEIDRQKIAKRNKANKEQAVSTS